MKIALIGQPNCGKSTIFNSISGYRSATANYPGTTVRISSSKIQLNGALAELADLPGVYSLSTSNPAEKAAENFLLNEGVDVVVNVMDASLLSRSLELTLELRELGIPMMVCLNMSDEAKRKGTIISTERLEALLNLPVVETVASRGLGIRELFTRLPRETGRPPRQSEALDWHRNIKEIIERMEVVLKGHNHLSSRFLAIKLLEGDEDLLETQAPETQALARQLREQLQVTHGRPAESVIMTERHDWAMHLFEQVAILGKPRTDVRESVDNLLTHPFWGYVFLTGILVGVFWVVFGFGSRVEQVFLEASEAWSARLLVRMVPGTFSYALASSIWGGVVAGAAIVLPYLLPFLFLLAFLEDAGYLPRVAYLTDGLFHRIGLHGTSTLPLILGYGCTVPACLATRILPSRRDRFLASTLATLVPCSARSTVILALVGFYLGPWWALGLYGLNAFIVILSGWLLAKLWPEISPGMVLEVPRYQWPSPRVLTRKVWLRLGEFIIVSWPLLVIGSAVLGVAGYWHWDRVVNAGLSPLTGLLGLPQSVGTTLIFGILRKELSVVMLMQALGTTHITSVIAPGQILVFTLFVMFYVPCLATIAVQVKEIGMQLTALIVGYTLLLATVIGLAARLILQLISFR